MKLVNTGFGNMINSDRILAIVTPDSAPVKRTIQIAKENGTLIDVTQGRKTLSVLYLDTGHVVLSCLKTEKYCDGPVAGADE